MSNTQLAFMARSSIPDPVRLQASIDRLGFDLKLDLQHVPFKDSGFWPCVLQGEANVGFEVFYTAAHEVTDDAALIHQLPQGRDSCMSMVWRSSMKDLACVMIVSCALARDFEAIVSYQGEPPEAFEAMLASTKAILEEDLNWVPPPLPPKSPQGAVSKPWWKFW
jgi:hypothetical protein